MQYDAPPDNGGDKPTFISAFSSYMTLDIYFRLTIFRFTVIVAPPDIPARGLRYLVASFEL
jgi:hypothetical protein